MGELNFHAGVMSSGKTASLIEQVKIFDDYQMYYCSIFSATGDDKVESRNGEVREALPISWEAFGGLRSDTWIFIDEAQFLSAGDVEGLRKFSYEREGNIECYGLLSNFKGKFFEGSEALVLLADNIYKLDTNCQVCHNNRAINNARTASSQDLIDLDKNNYIAVCNKCFEELQ